MRCCYTGGTAVVVVVHAWSLGSSRRLLRSSRRLLGPSRRGRHTRCPVLVWKQELVHLADHGQLLFSVLALLRG